MTQIPTWSGGPISPTSGRAAPGTTIGGRYALRAAVGHGGMGTVWRAADTLLRRDVAVKEVILPPGLAPSDRDAMYERTLREARAAAALQHPAVVQVYDVVTEAGRPWIVMELLDARSLADMVIEDGPLALRAVAKIGIALLGALEVAHAIGVLHRDVKPANVLICSDGRCVLTDFGVARMPTDVQLTTPGMVLGSPHFISPERAMGSEFGPPSDLFSLGVTLYTAVEGRPPFDRGDPIETMHAVVEDPPAPMTRAGVLGPMLMGLLEKDPARRLDTHTARNMLRELLAGQLASKAPGHLTTDPYSVVPAQRPAWQPPTPPAAPAPAQPAKPQQPAPTGSIGGRAMIAPGESLTDRLAALRKAGRQMPTPAQYAAAGLDPDNPGATGEMPAPQPQRWDEPTAQAWAPGGANAAATQVGPTIAARPSPPPGPATVAAPVVTVGAPAPPAAGGPGAVSQAVAGVQRTGNSLITTVKGWPRKIQLAAAGGLVVLLLIGAFVVFNGSDNEAPSTPPVVAPTEPAGPAFEVQTHAERGLSVNVPKDWKQTGTGVWIDFTDPEDSGRRVRILVEKANTDPMRFLQAAAGRLDKNASSCAKPYNQIVLRQVELAGQPAAELEYTCGDGETKRHGVWQAVIANGTAYSFYLTSPEARFEESRPVFDEMTRTFQVTGNG
ncbi:protein kinase [Polymorphospora sp. NPDC050346]|uniref:protein kinase domain-containing protein n=1 Tax=Polymorphospora sp. NPDC050346 TaxID=3155780 RepID=UPI0033D88E7D